MIVFFYTTGLGLLPTVDLLLYGSCENCERNGVLEIIFHLRTDFAACFQLVCNFVWRSWRITGVFKGRYTKRLVSFRGSKAGNWALQRQVGEGVVLSRTIKPFSESSSVTQSRPCASSWHMPFIKYYIYILVSTSCVNLQVRTRRIWTRWFQARAMTVILPRKTVNQLPLDSVAAGFVL